MIPTLFARPAAVARLAPAVAAAMLLAALPAAAGPGPQPPETPDGGPAMHQPHGPRPATIAVSGAGLAAMAPDLAVVTVGVTVQAPTAGEAMAQNAARQQAVIAALKDRSVAARDIQTSGLSLSPVQTYPKEGQPPVISGYQAANVVTVRLRDLAQMGGAIDAIVAAGANEIQGVSFQREDPAEAGSEARRRAVADARDRAEVIAAAAGQRLGRLVSIADTSGGAMAPQPMMMRAMAGSAADATPVEAGELSVSARVDAVWELIPEGEARRPGPGEVPPGGTMIAPPTPEPKATDAAPAGGAVPATDAPQAPAPATAPGTTTAPAN